jgi:hypothetical protein
MKRPEQQLQIACIKWFALQYPQQVGRLYMNYNNPPNAQTGGILKAMGLSAGIADLSYLIDGGRIVFIELKSSAGKQSENQKAFEMRVTELGAPYHIARDIYEFMGIINSYNS